MENNCRCPEMMQVGAETPPPPNWAQIYFKPLDWIQQFIEHTDTGENEFDETKYAVNAKNVLPSARRMTQPLQ